MEILSYFYMSYLSAGLQAKICTPKIVMGLFMCPLLATSNINCLLRNPSAAFYTCVWSRIWVSTVWDLLQRKRFRMQDSSWQVQRHCQLLHHDRHIIQNVFGRVINISLFHIHDSAWIITLNNYTEIHMLILFPPKRIRTQYSPART